MTVVLVAHVVLVTFVVQGPGCWILDEAGTGPGKAALK